MIEMESMAVAMPHVAGHPNRTPFHGVLTTVDVPSQLSPSGAKGHLVVLTRSAAEKALASLLGMALDYSPALDRHDVRRKVGVITSAEIVGHNLELEGYLFARDFPEIVEEISRAGADHRKNVNSGERNSTNWSEGHRLKSSLQEVARRILSLTAGLQEPKKTKEPSENHCGVIRAETIVSSRGAGLGLSYEVTDVEIRDKRAAIWSLMKVTFTGAAILRRDKAAYRNTWIELSGS